MANILIAECDPTAKEVYESIFAGGSHQVAFVESGEAFLDIYKQLDPDVIILAAELPGVSGLEICRHLRSLPESINLPIVVASEVESDEDAVSHIRAGADQFLVKPVRSSKLLTTVNLLIGRRQSKNYLPLKPKNFTGRYMIESVFHQQGDSSIYLARDIEAKDPAQTRVALKVVTSARSDALNLTAFSQRLDAVRRLDHKSIAPVFDYGVEHNKIFVSRMFVQGESLGAMICNSNVSETAAVIIAREVVSALSRMATLGIVHNNIKPNNIIADSNGSVHLVDFDLRIFMEQKTLKIGEKIFGLIQFISPECLMGDSDPSVKSDIYSLGMTLYYAVSGILPLYSEDPMTVFRRYLLDDPPPLSQTCPSISEKFSSLVARMTVKKPSKRISLQDLISELNALDQ